MFKERLKTGIPAAFIGIIALLAMVLGFIQYSWIDDLSRADTRRFQVSMNVAAAQVLISASMETSILLSFLYLTGEEYEGNQLQRFQDELELWREHTEFPGLLETIYLMEIDSDFSGFRFSEYETEEGGFRPAACPELLERYFRAKLDQETETRKGLETELLENGFLINSFPSPVKSSPLPVRNGGTGRSIPVTVLRINRDILYRTVIPFYMKKYMENYPYSLRVRESGTALVESGTAELDRRPEMTVALQELYLMNEPFLSSLVSGDLNRQVYESLHENSFFRFWLNSSKGFQEENPGGRPTLELRIYFPGGSLDREVRFREVLNLLLGIGFLLLFVASLIVLYYLYRRSQRVRIQERNFVAAMSHELRTPVAVIQAASDTLRSGEPVLEPPRVRRYGEEIYSQVRRLSGIVEGILRYSGLSRGTASPPRILRFDLAVLVRSVAGSLEMVARERGAVFRLLAPETLMLLSDPQGIRLILENFLSNALNHGLPDPETGISPEIGIRLETEPGMPADRRKIRLVVEDHGPGISLLEKRRIFDPFFRGRNVRGRYPGSGLGLHLASLTAALIGGEIQVQSPWFSAGDRQRIGSRFILILPFREDGDE